MNGFKFGDSLKCGLPKKPPVVFGRDPSTTRGCSYDCKVCLREQYKQAHPPKEPHSSNPQVMSYIERINERGIETEMKGYRPIECLQTRIKLDAIDLRILEAEAVAGALYLDRERILEPYKKREAEGLTNFEGVLP